MMTTTMMNATAGLIFIGNMIFVLNSCHGSCGHKRYNHCTMSPTVRALAQVAEALVPVSSARHTYEAVPAVDQQTSVASAGHERRVTGHSSIQSRRIGDVVPVQDVVHAQLVMHRST